MGKKSRTKGARGELELVRFLRDQGFNARRRAEGQAGSKGDPDVEITDLPWLFSEVKRCEALGLYPAVEQAETEAGEYALPFPPPCSRGSRILPQVPVVWHRRNNRGWLAIVPAVDFCRLLREIGPDGPGERT